MTSKSFSLFKNHYRLFQILLPFLFFCFTAYLSWNFWISFFVCFYGKGIIKVLFSEGVFFGIFAVFFSFTKNKITNLDIVKKIKVFLQSFMLKNMRITKVITIVFAIVFINSMLAFFVLPISAKVQEKGESIVRKYYPQSIIEKGEILNATLDSYLNGDLSVSSESTLIEPNPEDEEIYHYNINTNFILLNPDMEINNLHFYLSKFFYTDKTYLYTALEESLFSIVETKSPVSTTDSLYLIYNSQLMENDFLTQIVAAHNLTVNTETWREAIPDSSDLDSIIDSRLSIIANGTHSFYLYNKLSNNYQIYADEFNIYGTNADAVIYYYCKSIEMDMLSLAYSSNYEEMYTALDRIYMRYHDIAGCGIVDSDIRIRAQSIYGLIDRYYNLNN